MTFTDRSHQRCINEEHDLCPYKWMGARGTTPFRRLEYVCSCPCHEIEEAVDATTTEQPTG